MSRKKKTRSLRNKLSIKTGSKKDFFKPGQKGRIPSHNKLAKHRHRSLSAYQKYLLENGLTDTSSGQPGDADAWQTESSTSADKKSETTPRPVIGKQARTGEQPPSSAKATSSGKQSDSATASTTETQSDAHNRAFEDLSGDDLWDLLDND